MAHFVIALLVAAAFLFPSRSLAAQYEPTLMTERSLRYQTSFGLFEDDHEAFSRPRYLNRWDGARFASQLTQLSPAGEAAVGYGNGATDAWSWSVFASGGYRHDERLRSGQLLTLSGSRDETTQSLRHESGADAVPTQRGSAQAAIGASHPLAKGQLGFGLQMAWQTRSSEDVSSAPFLFTLPSPNLRLRSDTTTTAGLDEDVLFEESSFVTNPRTESRSLRAAAIAGYGRRPSGKRWGWALDLMAGISQLREEASVDSRDEAASSTGTAVQTYRTRTLSDGISPLAGLSLTFLRGGSAPLWIDVGGEAETGTPVDGEFGTTTGSRQVAVTTGGIQRAYTLNETRKDRQNGVLNRRYAATLGVRQSLALDPLLQLGWGLHAAWHRRQDENDILSTYIIDENFESNGSGVFDAGDLRISAQGESKERFERRETEVLVTLPLALLIRSATDPALEWRFASEIQYRNQLVTAEQRLSSMVLPSGIKAEGTGASTPYRYSNATLPVAGRVSERTIAVSSTVRAGLGYWFTPTAKVDVAVSAAPSGSGFLDFDDRSIGLSALLAF